MQLTHIPNPLHRPEETTELSHSSQFVSLRCWCICIQINDRHERRGGQQSVCGREASV